MNRKKNLPKQAVKSGEIKVTPTGDVIIGAPTAIALATPPKDAEYLERKGR